jgi:ubiquinone/menaquinone biosynthesis C-methylase UbiE
MTDKVSEHYTHGSLLEAIRAGVEGLGKTPDTVSVHDLGPVDEFHIGGRAASESFLEQLALSSTEHVLDVGCGLGGASRLVAERFGSRVSGIDLTHEYVETGSVLCSWVGLSDLVELQQGSATAMPYKDNTFDKAYMMHVGMNIADKRQLLSELSRVLKPNARLGIYDVMKTSEDALAFPVPWASTVETSFVESPTVYKQVLEDAGFRLIAERNRREFATEFFAAVSAGGKGPPPLGLHILMGAARGEKIKNMIENISAGRIAPVELIAEKN